MKERRKFDIFGIQSMIRAQNKSILDERKITKERISEIADISARLNNDDDYFLTPCRFAPSGWKYTKRSQNNPQ